MPRLVFLLAGLLFPPVLAQTGTDPGTGSIPRPFTGHDLDFEAGKALFQKNWVGAPASTGASDGLGPLYNARSCEACHGGAGRGRPFDPSRPGAAGAALVFQLAAPHERYGAQLQPLSLPGLAGEAAITLHYEEVERRFPDGETVLLRRPRYQAADAAGQALNLSLSARLAPPLYGVGLLDAVSAQAIAARADPLDADGDGVSGRAAGRFGWRAAEASLEAQTARALALDLGIGNPLYPDPYGDCTAAQASCRSFAAGGSAAHEGLEAAPVVLDTLLHYLRRLPAPAPSGAEARGEALFAEAGCPACHRPSLPLPGGEIRPYSDLLLHDMGPELADRDAQGGILDAEWRSAPLWGAGRGGPYLHDGRARSLTEAVLWHGGEAEAARDRFMSMRSADRSALIDFVSGL